MTERKMTEKGFIRKATSGKVAAAAFLAQHREWLTTGTLASLTSPILAKLDAGSLMPTPALAEINTAVLGHMVAREIVKGEAAAVREPREASSGTTRTVKPYTATIYDAHGNVCTRTVEVTTEEGTEIKVKDLISNFDSSVKAEGWCDRRLDDEGPGAFAEIVHNGEGFTHVMRVERDAAIGRLYGKRRPGPVTKGSPKSAPLGNSMRAKGDHFHFSRG